MPQGPGMVYVTLLHLSWGCDATRLIATPGGMVRHFDMVPMHFHPKQAHRHCTVHGPLLLGCGWLQVMEVRGRDGSDGGLVSWRLRRPRCMGSSPDRVTSCEGRTLSCWTPDVSACSADTPTYTHVLLSTQLQAAAIQPQPPLARTTASTVCHPLTGQPLLLQSLRLTSPQ